MTRHPFILAVVAGALALTACGGDDPTTTTPSSASRQDEAFEGALAFAKCMREHGVDMPDPTRDANGRIEMRARRAGGAGEANDAKMEQAQEACQKHMKGGGMRNVDPKRKAEMEDAFLAYARCMRKEGVDMPDPTFKDGGVLMRVGERGKGQVDPDSAAFKAADKVCHHFLDDVEREMKP